MVQNLEMESPEIGLIGPLPQVLVSEGMRLLIHGRVHATWKTAPPNSVEIGKVLIAWKKGHNSLDYTTVLLF